VQEVNGSSQIINPSSFESDDAALVLKCKKGDQGAWDVLVDRYQRLVYSIPRRAGLTSEQCDDVFQDVFLVLFQKLDEIEQPDKLRSWIVTTAKFKTWGIVRARRDEIEIDASAEDGSRAFELEDKKPLADEVIIELENQHLIRSAIAKLDERCQKIISMIYLRQSAASYEEVADAVGTGSTSISPMRSRCLEKLKKLLT